MQRASLFFSKSDTDISRHGRDRKSEKVVSTQAKRPSSSRSPIYNSQDRPMRASVAALMDYPSSPSLHPTTPTSPSSLRPKGSLAHPGKPVLGDSTIKSAFKLLPQEIYDCILRQIEILHSDPSSPSCATCYMRDLCSLALTSRAWNRAARVRLYNRIHILGQDSLAHQKKYKMKSGTRLKLLRRTLRGRKALAECVHELRVPPMEILTQGRSLAIAIDLVASLVMACPNLQRLVGFDAVYNHKFDRLSYALSTRRSLKEHVWLVGGVTTAMNRPTSQAMDRMLGILDPEQTEAFIRMHDSWSQLHTLFLHSQNGNGVIEHELFIGVLYRLPSLRHVYMSGFGPDQFTDMTLQALPALQSLRLQNLPGITDRGLFQFATTSASRSLQSLTLIDLELKSLLTLSKLMSSMLSLKRFTLIQDSSPTLPLGSVAIQPILASDSLVFLHWDILMDGDATSHLASSIRAGGFPALRKLRAPSDHSGELQAVCRPRPEITLPADRYSGNTFMRKPERAQTLVQQITQHQVVHSSTWPGEMSTPSGTENNSRSLTNARKAAQARLESARLNTSMRIEITDYSIPRLPNCERIPTKVLNFAGFLGNLQSRVWYYLEPDMEGSDVAIIEMGDILEEESREQRDKGGCTGKWNLVCRGGRSWWVHTERAHWRRINLGMFF
ncbi:MAG: hypothetical protein M1834_002274 [Cirrosporium novae-zelandiae]|nr:MAG: hypothetical protein M1834_002274 [Cirrosporium novae-zelandiae]